MQHKISIEQPLNRTTPTNPANMGSYTKDLLRAAFQFVIEIEQEHNSDLRL